MKCIFIVLLALFTSLQTNARDLDSLSLILTTSDSIEQLADANIEIGAYYTNRMQDTAMYFLNNAVDLASRASDKTLVASAYFGITEYLRVVQEDNEKAYLMSQKATELIRSAGDNPKLLIKYQGMTDLYGGVYQMELGNYIEAQEFFLKSIQGIEKVNQPRALIGIKHQLFVLYYTQGMLEEAEEIIDGCIDLCIENDWYKEQRIFLTNKAALATDRNDFKRSIAILIEAKQLMDENKDVKNYAALGTMMDNIGFNYHELEVFDSSYLYHLKGLNYRRKSDNLGALVNSYSSLCQDCAKVGELNLAKYYCDSMQVGLDSLKRSNLKENGLVAWIHYYSAVGELELTLENMEELMEFKEEKINEENVREQTAQKMDFEFEKERVIADNELLNSQVEIEAEKAFNDKLYFGLILVTVLSVLLLIVIFSNFKKRRIISKQNNILNNSVAEKETLLKEIHHRVKNNLQLVSSLLSLQSDSINDEQVTSIFEEGQNRVQAMALIHQKLYQNDVASEIDFQDYLQGLAGHFGDINADDKKVSFEIDCEDIKLDIDTAIPLGLIINELFTNAYKHAFKNVESPKLSVTIKNEGAGEYLLKMTDNGQGLPVDLDWAKTKTLGLRLIRNLVKQLIGRINYENKENLSVFSIQFKNQLGRNLLD